VNYLAKAPDAASLHITYKNLLYEDHKKTNAF